MVISKRLLEKAHYLRHRCTRLIGYGMLRCIQRSGAYEQKYAEIVILGCYLIFGSNDARDISIFYGSVHFEMDMGTDCP